MFRKRPIREHLAARGFAIVFRERAWRIFNTADVIIARSPYSNPEGH
jgi:hypothetical protein